MDDNKVEYQVEKSDILKVQDADFVRSFRDLNVYKLAFECAMEIFEISKSWPSEERYSLTDQIRRASRSVCSNIAEALRKRIYVAHCY